MAHLLALDIGTARTGVAFGDDASGFVVALDTLTHRTMDELATQVSSIVREKKIDQIVAGLPRLLSGEEGEQARVVRVATDIIKKQVGLPVTLLDERYTTITGKRLSGADHDAMAACAILTIFFERKELTL